MNVEATNLVRRLIITDDKPSLNGSWPLHLTLNFVALIITLEQLKPKSSNFVDIKAILHY